MSNIDKTCWSLLSEFEITRADKEHITLFHAKCNTALTVHVIPGVGMSLSTLVKYTLKHKKEDCKRLQNNRASVSTVVELNAIFPEDFPIK